MKKEQLKTGQKKKYSAKKGLQFEKQVRPSKIFELVGLAVIILLGIIIYSNSFNCSFQFDDYSNIVNNTKIHHLSDVKSWWNFSQRPVGYFTFALNYHFNGLDVLYWHLVNLSIHLINACLVGWLTLLIFSSPVMKDMPVANHKKVLAFIVALLFVSHPLASQSVTYIVQRLASLAAMFYLLSLALYMKARLSDNGNIFKTLLFTGSVISAVMAMLSKENAFTLPFAIVLFEIFFLQTKKISVNFRDYRLILLMAAFLGVILIIPLNYSFSIFKPIPPSDSNVSTITPINYLLTQFEVIVKYIRLLFFPLNQNIDYDFPVSNSLFEIRTLLSFLFLLSLIILAIFLFKRNRVISFGIFWFFLTLSIESSFIPIRDVIFEHRTYLPSFGFFLILISCIYTLFWNKNKYFTVFFLALIIGSNSFLTYGRNKVWKDNLTLWSDVVLKSPDKARPHVNRGFSYSKLGQWENAINDFSKAIGINPYDFNANYNRGIAYVELGKWDKAIVDYSRVIEINPKHVKAYINRGFAYGNKEQWDKAIADYSKAIEIDPEYANAYNNRGNVYGNIGKFDKSIADYTKAIEINPKYLDAYYNRGIAYGKLSQWDKSIADYSSVIEIGPKYTVYMKRGIAYGNSGQWDKAITDYSSAIAIDPKQATAYFSRGVAYGNLKQWDKAITDYAAAIGIDPAYPDASYNRETAIRKLHIDIHLNNLKDN